MYTYDREFQMHMVRFPSRNWAVILQQAWTVYLKDWLRYNDSNRQGSYLKHKKEECRRFNKGKCTAGMGCRFDHHCLECGKFGHGAHICRRKQSGQNNQSNSPSGTGSAVTTMQSNVNNNNTQTSATSGTQRR